MNLPAEMNPQFPIEDNAKMAGNGSDGCPECGSLWVFGHAEDCSKGSSR
jgi:hypothetical protein